MRRVDEGAADSEAAQENGGRFGVAQTDSGQKIERCAIAGKPNRAKAKFFVASDRNAAPRAAHATPFTSATAAESRPEYAILQ